MGALCAGALALSAANASELPRRGALGVSLQGVAGGVGVAAVQPGSGAARAGVQPGDRLVSINALPVSDPVSLQAATTTLSAEVAASLVVEREGEAMTLTFTPSALPAPTLDGAVVQLGHVRLASGDRIRTVTLIPQGVSGPAPAVYYIQGIPCAAIDSFANPDSYRTRLFRRLIEAGFIVGFADKPGMGDSEGAPCQSGGFDREVEAYGLAAAQLAARADVDASRIYGVGVSMGGIQAPLIAQEGQFDGIITWGSGVSPWHDYLVTTFRNRAIQQGQPASEAEPALDAMRWAMARLLTDDLTPEQIAALDGERYAAYEASWGPMETLAGRHFTFHQELDDTSVWAAWQAFEGDLLALQGEYDWVANDYDHALAAVIVNQARPGQAVFERVPGLDHGMTYHDSLQASYAAPFQGAQDEGFHDRALAWLIAQAGL